MYMEEDRKQRFYSVINDVGASIKALRIYRGLSVEDAANRMGITVKKLEAIERGVLTIHLNVVTDYIESLGGKLAIVPTDNAGLIHCEFLAI